MQVQDADKILTAVQSLGMAGEDEALSLHMSGSARTTLKISSELAGRTAEGQQQEIRRYLQG